MQLLCSFTLPVFWLIFEVRYFFHIGYNGFNYRGWQKLPQTKGANVQFIIETHLSRILKSDITIVGCGRTDAQVHAAQFFFHVDIEKQWDYDLMFRLNKNLPEDIAVFDILPVDATSHARFDAYSRTYNYFVHTYKDPYLGSSSACYLAADLRLNEMKRAAALLTKYNDYRAFSKNVPSGNSTICKVTAARLYSDAVQGRLRFEISSLNGMIRIIVLKLLSIGQGELSVSEFESYLATGRKPSINRLAHPQGLYLSKVKYPYLDIPTRSGLFNLLMDDRRWVQV